MHIDAHQHFWRYTAADYGWIDDSMKILRRDFLPNQLEEELRRAGIDGTVAVEARQSLEETRWLLSLATEHEFVKGVVGWAPLTDPKLSDKLSELCSDRQLCGIRHVLQGEADEFMLQADFNRGISALAEFGLVYDILIVERQLPQAIEFVDRHPKQPFVLDHLAKPRIKDGTLEPWRNRIQELAQRPNVVCKLSGMVTEAAYELWTEAGLRPYFETVLEAFGPSRLMFGSDWPVCLVASPYTRWTELVLGWIGKLTKDEQSQILGKTAVRVYGL